ncbi:MAG: hypothetical protein KA252_03275, partial [Sphingorhabdus sp.]|nr:hypothetical protein [Sphingorhabdus sp.]
MDEVYGSMLTRAQPNRVQGLHAIEVLKRGRVSPDEYQQQQQQNNNRRRGRNNNNNRQQNNNRSGF